LLALALAAIAFRSSAAKRTGTIRPFASPFGSFGRPALRLLFIHPSILINYCRFHGFLSRGNRPKVQDRYMPLWSLWILCFVRPRIDSFRSGMATQIEHFNYAFPYGHPFKYFFDRDAFDVGSLSTMKMPNYIAQLFEIRIHNLGGDAIWILREKVLDFIAPHCAPLKIPSNFLIEFSSRLPFESHTSPQSGQSVKPLVVSSGNTIFPLQFLHSNSTPRMSLSSIMCFVSNVTM